LKDATHLAPKIVEYLDNPNINTITTEDLDNFVDRRLDMRMKNGELYSPRTVINEINFLSALFNYGIKKGHMIKNPTLEVKMPDYKAPVGICKPEDLETLLSHADHFMQCHIMFGAFGGLRSSEIMRMDWSDVRLDEGQFYIHGTKNSHAERWVQLTPPLMDFCKQLLGSDNPPKGLVMGGMVPKTRNARMVKLVKAAGVKIPRNGLRHSYGSHHLVHYEKADKTAQEMGHIGPQQTFRAYRKAVLKSQAAEFFAIKPEAKAWVLKAGMGIKKPRAKAA
jgi:integrase